MPNTISALAEELMRREMAENPEQFQTPRYLEPREPEQPMQPEIAALIGAGMDGFGTYKMLHAGAGGEGNPILRKLFRHDPVQTGLGAAAFGVGMVGVRNLLRKKGGFWAKLADVMAGQQGADQLSLGIQNLQRTHIDYPGARYRWADRRNGFQRNAERLRNGVTGTRK